MKAAFAVALGLVAAREAAAQTVFEIVEASTAHNTLELALTTAGLDGTLDGAGTFQLFAPTDAAFTTYLNAIGLTATELLDDSACLSDVLLLHVVDSATTPAFPATALNGGNIQTASTATQEVADNGNVFVVDAVIDGSIAAVATNNMLTTLVDQVVAAKVAADFVNPCTEFTVFAPTNAAFSAPALATPLSFISRGVDNDDEYLTGVLANILLTHVIATDVLSSTEVLAATTLTAANGQTLTVDGSAGTINDADITATDVKAGLSVVHVIDAVLLPDDLVTDTIAEIAAATPTLSTLVAAVTAGGLLDAISTPQDNSWTVFAPTNAAFEAALAALDLSVAELAADAALIDTVLKAHIISGAVLAADLPTGPGATVTTLGGEQILVSSLDINTTDVRALNGVVHILNSVIIPPSLAPTPEPTSAAAVNGPAVLGVLVAALAARLF